MSEKMPMEIYACEMARKQRRWDTDPLSNRQKYHHDDKHRALEDEIKRLRIKLKENENGTN